MKSISKYLRLSRFHAGISGFTLLEVIVVITILSILSAVAIPSFFKWSESAKLKGTAFGLVSNLKFSRELAITSNVESRVELDIDGKRYRITKGNFSSGSTSWATYNAWTNLDTEINWGTGTACSGNTDINITHRPNGSSVGGTICIKDTNGADRYKVVINSVTGMVQIK